MVAFDRRSIIIQLLNEKQRVSTRMLSDQFSVSEVTIRHDLDTLEQQGIINRIHGGAEINRHTYQLLPEQSFVLRGKINIDQKKAIAKVAASIVRPGDTLIMDISTSVYEMVPFLRNIEPLRIVTNCLRTANELASYSEQIEVILVGGIVRYNTASLIGLFAEEMFAKIHADHAFLGTTGLTIEGGCTDADNREVKIKQSMVRAAHDVNILMDSSKFGERSFLTFAHCDEIDRLFTDDKVPPDYVKLCEEHNINLIIANIE